MARKEGNQTTDNQKQTSTSITGTKPKTKKPQEPNQTNTKPPRNQQTSRNQNNEGGKQQTLIDLLKPKPREETTRVTQENQPIPKPNPKPNQDTHNQTNARPHPNPDVNTRDKLNECDKTKPDCETIKPDIETKPGQTKKKPPKLKTKVVHPNDLQMFLAAKKKERELKLLCLRDNEKNLQINTPSDRCSATLHPIQPPPLLHSASGSSGKYTALHRTVDSGNKESNANPGEENLSSNLLLADSRRNLG